MQISDARRVLVTAALVTVVLSANACTQPVAGVLTLAPAGMRLGGTCTRHADGTLTMAAGASAESDVYVDAGTVTITVTAAASTLDQPTSIEVWFAGASLGSQPVPSAERTAIRFHARARTSGPVAIRLVVHATAPGSTAASPTLEVEKIVIT